MRHPSGIDRRCMVKGCQRKHFGHDRCKFHYQQWYRSPDFQVQARRKAQFIPLANRLWAKVDFLGPNGCWLWTGAVDGKGYGHLSRHHGELVKAHRLSYELKRGPIPEGLTIDHRCRTKRCVNPEHLEAVTGLENFRRFVDSRMACKNGHTWTEETTYWYRGRRGCRPCHAARERVRRQRLAA